jgi:glycosyltransferase 2 family protein
MVMSGNALVAILFLKGCMKKILGLLLRLAVTGGCLAYAMWGVNFPKLFNIMSGFGVLPMLAVAACVLASVVPTGLRMVFLVEKRAGFTAGYNAVSLGLALNNILPARMGEVGKAFYLTKQGDVSMGRALEAVFWERFADLNALLALGVFAAAFMRQWTALYPLMAVVGGLWCFLALCRIKPGIAHALINVLPGERLRLVFSETLLLLKDKLSAGFLGKLGGYTLLAWACYLAVYVLAIRWAIGLDLSLWQIATAFAVATMGFAIPAAPGGMGVYEAAFVLAMSWFGVGREEAFAVGFTLHMIQYVPMTAYGLGVMAVSGFTPGAIRGKQGE